MPLTGDTSNPVATWSMQPPATHQGVLPPFRRAALPPTLSSMSEARLPGRSVTGIAVVFEGGILVMAWGLGRLLGIPLAEGIAFTGAALALG